MSGQKFNKLLVLSFKGLNKFGKKMWLCKCDCGTEIIVVAGHLKSGNTKSCGCFKSQTTIARNIIQKTKHGMAGKSRTYDAWCHMKQRCCNPSHPAYNHYGGRGITVCARWLDKEKGFENFYADRGDCSPGMTLERIDNNGNYEPNNCVWATPKVQANNRRNNVLVILNGEKVSLEKAANLLGVKYGTLWWRIRNNKKIEGLQLVSSQN